MATKILKTKKSLVSGIGNVTFYAIFRNGLLESYVTDKKGVNVPRENLISGNWKELDIQKAPDFVKWHWNNVQ